MQSGPGHSLLRLQQFVAVGSRQLAAVDLLESVDDLDRFVREGRFAFKTVQDNALQKVSKRQLAVLCEPLQDLQERFLRFRKPSRMPKVSLPETSESRKIIARWDCR